MSSLLEAQHVSKMFGSGLLSKGQTLAVDGVSLIVREDNPSITAIAGESGSGKTTLARLLLGVTQPTSGSILYRGEKLTAMDGRARKNFRREVQAIFQDPYEAYNPVYKVDQVLTTPVRKFRLAHSKDDELRRVEESLRMAGLRPEDTLGRYPHQLSGGQRQRIMVARALLLRPRVLLADEPVSMVDASLRATILESLVKLRRELGISLIYITHDLTTAYQVSQNIYVLYRGSVAEVGSVDRVIKEPKHPYTQLLVESIPLPDPDVRWTTNGSRPGSTAAQAKGVEKENHGCKFATRCPYVMAECWETPPPLFRIDEDRAAACYLYKDNPAVSGKEMAESIARPPVAV
ncbi:MAG: ABC transporter ATP-binding protein [Chloroflexi bacterium]|nr:ABC transporter ATP-binding protein [Chloroflexota bacterium]MBV9543550.1 ABC transporter ATP-binding protein [Chloroflexota bacterium]